MTEYHLTADDGLSRLCTGARVAIFDHSSEQLLQGVAVYYHACLGEQRKQAMKKKRNKSIIRLVTMSWRLGET